MSFHDQLNDLNHTVGEFLDVHIPWLAKHPCEADEGWMTKASRQNILLSQQYKQEIPRIQSKIQPIK